MNDTARELPPPVDAADLYSPSIYIKASTLRGQDRTWKVSRIGRREVIKKKKGEPDKVAIEGYLVFELPDDQPNLLTLNVTNRKAMEAMFGDSGIQKAWTGKWVTLMTSKTRDPRTGTMEPCIRIKGSPDIARNCEFLVSKLNANPVKHTMVPTPAPESAKSPEPTLAPKPENEHPSNPDRVISCTRLISEANDATALLRIYKSARDDGNWSDDDKKDMWVKLQARVTELGIEKPDFKNA